MPLPTIKKGDLVAVYLDPITCKRLEGEAIVKSVRRVESWNDEQGRPIHRCEVRFVADGDEPTTFTRDISEKVTT